MRRRIPLLGVISLLVLTTALPVAADPGPWLDKVHPRVLSQIDATGQAEFLIFLDEQTDPTPPAGAMTKTERGRAVFESLSAVAARSQAPLIARLEAHDAPYRSFWIANMIWVRGGLDVVAEMASRGDVRRIDANPRVRVHETPFEGTGEPGDTPIAVEWGLLKVNADDVWALGYDGSGIVIAGQDTGYEWTHPALVDHYRGWNGSTADHDHNWHDSVHSGGGSCGSDSPFPCDDNNHGTHTMGTMVGDDGGSNRTGMAPGAEWIACRNMDQGNGTPATYSECFEFFVAPTDLAGQNPDPSKAPHVIGNSWTCPPSEGCSADTLATVVRNTRLAGIVVVVAASNAGPDCHTIDVPPAIYDDAFTIGATDSTDQIASFSARGTVTVDGSDRLKPDVSAPGVSVRSSVRGGGYGTASGTSMATPHVAGLVALLLDARPDLIGRVEAVETLIRLSAVPRTDFQECGGIPGSVVPNPIYGHGRIDALETITGDADGDGESNLSDCAPLDSGVWTSPGPVDDLALDKGDPGTELSWSAPLGTGVGTLRFDVLRSGQPTGFVSPTCLVAGTPETTFEDTDEVGAIVHYLVRAANVCGASVAQSSDGTPRAVGSCGSEFPVDNF